MGVGTVEGSLPMFFVDETDDVGIWVRILREDAEHIFLVRWEYVLAVDVPAGGKRTLGLKP